jgi:hypothetical protein
MLRYHRAFLRQLHLRGECMRDHELVLWLAELIKADPEAAEAQGVDRSTFERLILAVADEDVLDRAGQLADLMAPGGREVFYQFLTRVQAGGRH